LEVVNSIYSSIMGGSAKESQLGASLAAGASRPETCSRNFQERKSSRKMDYLETQKKLLLVSKIVA
jgi:hypothetical protein